jgi:hypothetical protein
VLLDPGICSELCPTVRALLSIVSHYTTAWKGLLAHL